MAHLDDCPLCQKIVAGEIEKETDFCVLVVIGNVRVAALKEHTNDLVPEALLEAFDLVRKNLENGFVGDYSGAPGHWAVRRIPTGELPVGRAEGRAK